MFEHRVMPYFYKLMLTYEWRTLLLGSFAAFIGIALLGVVGPLVQSADDLVVREVEHRAQAMAKVLVEINQPLIQQRAESRVTVPESIERGLGVKQAMLVDMDLRILAPSEKLNQYLTTGSISAITAKAKQQFLDQGRSKAVTVTTSNGAVVVVEPMVLYSQRDGKNIPVAMGVVSLDSLVVTQGAGDVAVTFSNSLIVLGVAGLLISLLLYRVTLKPLQILHEEMDRALKGEGSTITREIKFSELGQLLDVAETAIQRAARGGSAGQDGAVGGSVLPSVSEEIAAFRMLGDVTSTPVAVCDSDRRPVYLNTSFEDVTGIRADAGEMQQLSALARDQAFGAFLSDLFDRSPGVPEGLAEDFEFSGVCFNVRMVALSSSNGGGGQPRGFVLFARRQESG
jgi:PAS domain-containing protein